MEHLERIHLGELHRNDRPVNGHKGTFGRVLVLAGSPGMSGAACLSACAALRGGAGLVYVAVPQSIQSTVAGFEPSYLTYALPCSSDGYLSAVPRGEVSGLLEGKDAVAIGPGLGQSHHAGNVVLAVLKDARCPVVVDADALNLAAERDVWPKSANGRSDVDEFPRVVTPHPGEFSRLTGLSIAQIERDREGSAVQFARRHGLVVVLKGPGTVVTDGHRIFVNPTGNSGMGTGGTGDVLTGLLAAQLGQGIRAFDAACLAVYVHGLAGDIAASDVSQRGLIASDLLRYIGPAWLRFEDSSPAG